MLIIFFLQLPLLFAQYLYTLLDVLGVMCGFHLVENLQRKMTSNGKREHRISCSEIHTTTWECRNLQNINLREKELNCTSLANMSRCANFSSLSNNMMQSDISRTWNENRATCIMVKNGKVMSGNSAKCQTMPARKLLWLGKVSRVFLAVFVYPTNFMSRTI